MAGLATDTRKTNEFKPARSSRITRSARPGAPKSIVVQAMFFGISGLVLFIVCLNVSGMMLVRSAMRERELAVRLAIGASRARLMQYLLAESLVLAFLGGTLAVGLLFGVPAVLTWWFDWWHPDLICSCPDVWTYATRRALLRHELVFGSASGDSLQPPRARVGAQRRDAGGGGRRVGRMHRLTAAIQAGIAVPFLVIGGVKLDQVRTTAAADVGFAPNGLFCGASRAVAAGRPCGGRTRSLDCVRDNLARAAGVSPVTVADGVPLDFRYRIERSRERA